MKKLTFIYFLLCTLTASTQPAVDSFENLIATTDNDSLKMEWYNQLRKATIYNDLEQASGYAQQYLAYAKQLNLSEKVALGQVYLGNTYVQREQYEKGLALFLPAIKYFESKENARWMAGTYNSIAVAYENMGRDSLTKIYFEKSLAAATTIKRYYSMAIALNNLSNIAFREEDYIASADYIRRAIVELQKDTLRAKEFLPLFEVNLANSLVKQRKFERADSYYKKVLGQLKNSNYTSASALLHYGYSQLEQGEIDRAIQLLEDAERLIHDNQFYNLRSDVLNDLATAYEAQGNYRQAYQKLNALKTVEDSIFTAEKTQALANALQAYEADKKNQQIELLSSQNELKDLKILRNQRERLAMLGGLLALGLIAGLIYRNNRLRARANDELERKNAIINKALDEKNLLLKEIHHRVKNNLQVISSLLRLQSRYIDDETALEAIQESQNRVRSMSLLHQNLYRDDRLTDVEVQTYFNQLIDELFQSYQVNQQQIKIVKNIAPLQLDVDTVIPLGLIVNELITNALKYAFAEAEQGVIQVDLQQNRMGLRLQVRDDGVGVDPEVFRNSRSFGNRMIRAFVAKLEGEFKIKNEAGTIFEMQLPFADGQVD